MGTKYVAVVTVAILFSFSVVSCNKDVVVDPLQPTTGKTVNKDSLALIAADPNLKAVAEIGKFSAAVTGTVQCDGYLTHQKTHWAIDWLNAGPVAQSKNITGGKKLVGVLETAPAVAKGDETLVSTTAHVIPFWEAFDCSKIATFESLRWTVDATRSSDEAAYFYAGYFLDKNTSVSYALLVTKTFVRLECKQQTAIDGVVIPNTISVFSLKFAYESGTVTPPVVVDPPVTPGTGTTAGKLVIYYEGGKIRVNEDIINAADRPKPEDVTIAFNKGQVVLQEAAKVTGLTYKYPDGSFANGLSAWDWYGYYLYHSGAASQLAGGTWTKSENSQATTWKKVQGGFIFYMHVTKASTIYKPLDSATIEQPGDQFFIMEVVKDGPTEGTKDSPVSVGVWPLQKKN